MKQEQAGNWRAAAITLRQALDAEPGEPLLHNLAASLLLITGDPAGAAFEYQAALTDSPGDGLAQYGLGLAHLVRGDREKAREALRLAEQSADPAAVMLASRYIEALDGAGGSGAGLALPDAYSASVNTLSGLRAARIGDHRSALAAYGAALAALPGDPYSEPPGLVMTFDKARPIRFGVGPLPTGNGLAVARRISEPPVHGTVLLGPGDVAGQIGYIVFKIDGGLTSIANTAPYKLSWDTEKVANGLHRVEVMVYDRQGDVVRQIRREVRTFNANSPVRNATDGPRTEAVRNALWQMLALRPSRAMLSFAAAEEAQAAGQNELAGVYLQQTVAVDPLFHEARTRAAALFVGASGPSVWRGGQTGKLIALTFDDGPKPGHTERLLAVLQQERVPATFFVIGQHATAHPDLIRKIADAGMEIENHTYTHPNLTILQPATIERELLRTEASVQSVTGKRMRFFRPPGGNMNPDVSKIAAIWGLTPCMWTLDGEALESGSPTRLIQYVVDKSVPGAIVLMHNGRPTTVEALPKILDGLRKRGFSFVTVEQLIAYRDAERRQAAGAAGSTKSVQ